MRPKFLLATFALIAGCTGRDAADLRLDEPVTIPQPVAPKVRIDVAQTEPDAARLRVVLPKNWRFGARVTWYRNGQTFPTEATTEVATALPPDTNPDPFAEESTTETWAVEVVPRHWLGVGNPVSAETEVVLSRGCEPFHPGWVYVGCRRDVVFSVPLTEPVNLQATSPVLYLGQFVERHFLGRPGTAGHDRLRAFMNLLLVGAVATTEVAAIPHDRETYLLDPAQPIWPEKRLVMDQLCMDIPLVGFICLHGYNADVDNEMGDMVYDFGPEAEAAANWWAKPATPVTMATPASYGTYDVRPLGGRRFEIAIRLHKTTLDLLWEPPTDHTLMDIKNDYGAAGYDPKNDLSSYLKAYGKAALGTPFEARFEVTVPSGDFNRLDFSLITVGTYKVDFQFVFRKGPYCNNNLGTTETAAIGWETYSAPEVRPFDSAGVPMFPGLISDTNTGAQGGGYDNVLRSYYATMSFTYPHEQSNPGGGSGVGRDRLGVYGGAYEFDPENGRYSDNPNNCVRPADACSVPGSQDGGPGWQGIQEGCEYPNVSDNGDDATYTITEQITSIVPYLQGELKIKLEHTPWH